MTVLTCCSALWYQQYHQQQQPTGSGQSLAERPAALLKSVAEQAWQLCGRMLHECLAVLLGDAVLAAAAESGCGLWLGCCSTQWGASHGRG